MIIYDNDSYDVCVSIGNILAIYISLCVDTLDNFYQNFVLGLARQYYFKNMVGSSIANAFIAQYSFTLTARL